MNAPGQRQGNVVHAAPSTDDAAARLATPLLSLAARILTAVPPGFARPAVASLRAFVDAPSAAGYLAARRALHAARRTFKLSALGRAAGPRRTERGLALLARVAELPASVLEELAAIPPDPRNGRRLQVIADLFAVHRTLTERAEAGLRQLQASLGPPQVPTTPAARRRARLRSSQ